MPGFSERRQPTEGAPKPPIGGVELSSNPDEFLEADAFNTVESPENGKSQGDQPNYTLPPFADGKDLRNRG